jgi:cell division septal protein FtsQ
MLKVLPILAVVVVLVTLGIFLSPLFSIKNVQVATDNKCVTPNFVKNADVVGQNLLTFSAENLINKLKKQYSCVQSVKVQKNFPGSLKVIILSSLPLAKIDGTNLIISGQNSVTSGSGTDLPVVFLPYQIPLKIGSVVADVQLIYVLKILNQLKDTDFIVSSARVVDQGNIIVYNRENVLAIFSSAQDLSVQISSLQEVIAKSKIDATKIQKIDLRFNKPIIVFK